jgi:fructose-specific phosphotransferase system IIC component
MAIINYIICSGVGGLFTCIIGWTIYLNYNGSMITPIVGICITCISIILGIIINMYNYKIQPLS